MKLKKKNMNVPHGILAKVAKRVKKSPQSVGATLGIYDNTTIGVSDEKKLQIVMAAKEVANEQIILYQEFLRALND